MNPYQEVIDWLASPEGERWSEAYVQSGPAGYSVISVVASRSPAALPGVFSIKPDREARWRSDPPD